MIDKIDYFNGDVFCFKHGYQLSGDNTCEICYRYRLEKNGPLLIEQMVKSLEKL